MKKSKIAHKNCESVPNRLWKSNDSTKYGVAYGVLYFRIFGVLTHTHTPFETHFYMIDSSKKKQP